VDRVSIERMCAGREFQVEGADTENTREEKLFSSMILGPKDSDSQVISSYIYIYIYVSTRPMYGAGSIMFSCCSCVCACACGWRHYPTGFCNSDLQWLNTVRWLGYRVVACWTQAQKGPGTNGSRDAVG